MVEKAMSAPLKNAKHERFAQEIAKGHTADEAYVLAGYQESRKNAARLKSNEDIRKRIEDILSVAAEKAAISRAKVFEELGKIAFADIRKAVEWRGALTRETDNPDGGDVLIIKEIFSNHVRLIDSDRIDNATAAAIAEVKQSPTGGLSIKFHDKQAALVALGKDLGMFKEQVEHTGKGGGPMIVEVVRFSDTKVG